MKEVREEVMSMRGGVGGKMPMNMPGHPSMLHGNDTGSAAPAAPAGADTAAPPAAGSPAAPAAPAAPAPGSAPAPAAAAGSAAPSGGGW